jgi:hypothetical protein
VLSRPSADSFAVGRRQKEEEEEEEEDCLLIWRLRQRRRGLKWTQPGLIPEPKLKK